MVDVDCGEWVLILNKLRLLYDDWKGKNATHFDNFQIAVILGKHIINHRFIDMMGEAKCFFRTSREAFPHYT